MPPPESRAHHYQLVIFDLDGTLVDTAPEITDALNVYLRGRGMPEASGEEVRGWIGHGARELLHKALASRGLNGAPLAAEELRRFGDIYADYSGRNSHVYPEGLGTLDALKGAGIRLALMTNKETRFVQPLLQSHRLEERFELVVCGDTLVARKPDPRVARHCMDAFAIGAGQSLLLGDSEIDIATARAAGIAVWAVDWGYGRSVAAARPDRMVSSFREVADRLLAG